MIRGIWSYGKKKTKQYFKVGAWVNYNGLRDSSSWLKELLLRVYDVPSKTEVEDFNTAMQRLGLDEAALQKRQRFFKSMILLYMACFVLMLAYGYGYLYVQTHDEYLLLATVFVSLLLLAQAFRYSYWLCQIARRKLGCSAFDWFLWLIKVRP